MAFTGEREAISVFKVRFFFVLGSGAETVTPWFRIAMSSMPAYLSHFLAHRSVVTA